MTWRVNEVDEEARAILALLNEVQVVLGELIEEGDGSGLDGDAALLLILRVSVKRVSPARAEAMMPALHTRESVNVDLPWST